MESWFTQGIAALVRLAWDRTTGLRWAEIVADLHAAGKEMPVKDSMIAATALVHGLTVATRNVGDFQKSGVKVVDPFA